MPLPYLDNIVLFMEKVPASQLPFSLPYLPVSPGQMSGQVISYNQE